MKKYVPDTSLDDAACAGSIEPLWDWVVDGEGTVQQQLRWQEAVRVCLRSCPVREACESKRTKRDYGVWGGRVFTPKGVKG